MTVRCSRLMALAAAVFVAALLLPEPPAEAASTRLQVSASAGQAGTVLVMATLTDGQGKPLESESVSLYIATNFLGGRPALIGTEKTDSDGVATFVYEPTSAGEQKLETRFTGKGPLGKAVAATVYKVASLPPAAGGHGHGETPLLLIWRLVGLAAAFVTISIWAILIGTLLWVRSGVRRLSLRPGPAVGTRHD